MSETENAAFRKQLEDALKKVKERDEQIEKLNASNRSFIIEKGLTSQGVKNVALAKYFPNDIDPSDTDAVKGWIEENQTVFNFGIDSSAAAPAATADTTAGTPAAANADYVNSLAAQQNLNTNSGTSATSAGLEGISEKIANAKSQAEIAAIIANS